jgi:hypothetical protein
VKTTAKITAVTVSTNIERPKIVCAGVDAGAKMFVELTEFLPFGVATLQHRVHKSGARAFGICWL